MVLVSEPSLEWNQIDAMHWLVDDAKPGDSFFFHCALIFCSPVGHMMYIRLDSGHGCETKDSYGIQEDGFNKGTRTIMTSSRVLTHYSSFRTVIYPVDHKTTEHINIVRTLSHPTRAHLTHVNRRIHIRSWSNHFLQVAG